MKDLQSLRDGWEALRRAEANLVIDPCTPAASLHQFTALWQSCAALLKQTEKIFDDDRKNHLSTLQQRLLRLHHGKN